MVRSNNPVQLDTHGGNNILLYLHCGEEDDEQSLILSGKHLTLFYDITIDFENEEEGVIDWGADSYIVMSEDDTSIEVHSGSTEVYTPFLQAHRLTEVNESFRAIRRAFAGASDGSYVRMIRRSKREVSIPNKAVKVFAKSIHLIKE